MKKSGWDISSEEIADEIQREGLKENIPYYASMIEEYADKIAKSQIQALKEELEPALKQALIENYKKGNDGKRRNCLGSIESNVDKMFDGLNLENLITNLEE